MADSMTFSLANGVSGALPGPNGMVREEVQVVGTGTVANDESPYVCQFVRQPDRIEGPFGLVSANGSSIVVASIGALDNDDTYQMAVIGYGG